MTDLATIGIRPWRTGRFSDSVKHLRPELDALAQRLTEIQAVHGFRVAIVGQVLTGQIGLSGLVECLRRTLHGGLVGDKTRLEGFECFRDLGQEFPRVLAIPLIIIVAL